MAYDTACALLIFPAFAYLATAVEPGPAGAKLFAVGGGVSYALYLLHGPLGGALNQVFNVYGHPKGSPAVGIAFVSAAAVIAWLVEKYWDRPIRRWLTERLRFGPPSAPAGRRPQEAVASKPS
jgi:peptidoglycan/LPS O-acetylase OafA/YrhL